MAMPDISAMKLSAIAGRGKKRDFVDLYYLLQIFDLSQILEYYTLKFPEGSRFLVLKSLAYFEDAEDDQDLIMLKDENWDDIKRFILVEMQKLT